MRKIGEEDRCIAYHRWVNMKQRCLNKNNPDYRHYGGRGIIIDKEFIDEYSNYRSYVSKLDNAFCDGYSIDRIDNNVGYTKGNLRWVKDTVQRQNTRIRVDNTSGHKGVGLTASGRWLSRISHNKKRITLGTFVDKQDAIDAYVKYNSDNNLNNNVSVCE